jgi:lauroyl/myristoyl acyltransferase
LTAHFGNWEAQASAWGHLGVDLLGAARPLRSRLAQKGLAGLRARHGIHVVTSAVPRNALRHLNPPPKNTSLTSPTSATGLSSGGCFGILWDQHAPDSVRSGSFCGEPVSLNPLPFFLLAHRPCPVFFGVLLPDGTLRLIPLLARADISEKGWEDLLARRYHRVLETLVKRHPAQWHGVLHARFKMTRTYVGHRKDNNAAIEQ